MRASLRSALLTIGLSLPLVTASTVAQSPSLPAEGGGTAGVATDCTGTPEECLRAALDRAASLAERMPTDLRIEAPAPYRGGQRTDSWVSYLEDTVLLANAYWARLFTDADLPYEHVGYVIVGDGTAPQTSNCHDPSTGEPAVAEPEAGPFYCAVGGQALEARIDDRGVVYIGVPALIAAADEANPGSFDFAVVAIVVHELGHHVEHQLVGDPESGFTATTATWWELGADCLAGVFAHSAYHGEAGQLTDTDVEEAMNLLHAWGNDLPYDLGGDPHGTREQRTAAFRAGYDHGSASRCLTAEWPTS